MDIPPQVGDLVRVGRGTVPWRVTYLSPIPGVVSLASTKTAMQRSEVLWNLSPFPAVTAPATSDVLAAAGRAAPRAGTASTVGLVLGGVAVSVAAGGALVARRRRVVARKRASSAEVEVTSAEPVDD